MGGNVIALAQLPGDDGNDGENLQELLEKAGSLVAELAPKGPKSSGPSYRSIAERYGHGTDSASHIGETFSQAGMQISEFKKNQRKIERRLKYDSNRGAVGYCYRGVKKAVQKVTGAMPESSLDSMVSMHLALVDNIQVDFKHIVNMCEDYVEKLIKYEAELFARLEGSCEAKGDAHKEREDADTLYNGIMKNVQGREVGARERLRSEHMMFRLEMKEMTQNRAVLCGDMAFYYDMSNKDTIQELAKQMHNLETYCKGICVNLDGIRDHLAKVLPVYATGARIANAAVDMDSMLRMLGRFSESIFANYTNGVSLVEQLHTRQPLDNMYNAFRQRLGGMNERSLGHLAQSSEYFEARLGEREY